jgi:predicted DNA-binding transcriptional regulator AlpA
MSQSVVVISPDELRSIVSDAVIAAVARAQLVSVSRKAILSEKEAAALLDVNPGTLKRWRSEGKGPAYTKDGSVRYLRSDIDQYLERMRVSTKDSY